MLGLHVAGDSGAYLNPAITLSNCIYRELPWRRFPMYFAAQMLVGFVGSGIVYANCIGAIDWFEDGKMRTVPLAEKATAAIFCTHPQPFVIKKNQFFSEFVASTLPLFAIFIYTGPSPISSPWLGLKQLTPGNAMRARREHIWRKKEKGIS